MEKLVSEIAKKFHVVLVQGIKVSEYLFSLIFCSCYWTNFNLVGLQFSQSRSGSCGSDLRKLFEVDGAMTVVDEKLGKCTKN